MILEKIEVLNAAGVWGSSNSPRCCKSRTGPSMGNQENPIFTAQKAIDWVICSFLCKIQCCLRNFCIHSSSWNNYDLWFFSLLNNICLWNFKFDSWIMDHELLKLKLLRKLQLQWKYKKFKTWKKSWEKLKPLWMHFL